MSYREHAPSKALAARIECHWTRTGVDRTPTRVLPDGCIDLLFDLRRGRAQVVGVMTRAIVSGGDAELLGVRFRAGEAPAWLGFSARESRDALVDLGDAWGTEGRALADRIAQETKLETRLAIVEQALLSREAKARAFRRGDHRVRRAIAVIESSRGAIEIEPLARSVGLGARQLERAFDLFVGVGPKALARIARLRALVERIRHARVVCWADLSIELGYADQAHLIRDVGKLAGVTPVQLMSEMSNRGARAGDRVGA